MNEQQPATPQEEQLERARSVALVSVVESLNEEAKTLALNLALVLAKMKADAVTSPLPMNRLEPEFMRLVSSTVQIVSELNHLILAARNEESLVWDPPAGMVSVSQLELRLRGLAEQAAAMANTLKKYQTG